MCDVRLTTTPESLLARIFELENTVSLLKHGIKQSDTTDFQQSNSANVTLTDLPNASEAPRMNSEKASNEKTAIKSSTDDFRMLFCWNEILESIGKTKKGLHGLLDSSSCYVNNNTYVIKVKNPFLAKMIASEENLSSIKAAMISTGELNPPEKIIVESEHENTLNANFLIEELAKDNNLF